MDKYYEAQGWIDHKHRGTTVDATHPLVVIGEALEKARKFDQFVEARKCSTGGSVETHACRTIGCPDYGIKVVDVERLVEDVCVEVLGNEQDAYHCLLGAAYIDRAICHIHENGYLRTPANITREDE